VQSRVPMIERAVQDLVWQPKIGMEAALRKIYDAYRGQIAEARGLVD